MTKAERRTARELETVRAMIDIYCRDHHGTRQGRCADCEALWQYADARVEHCPFGAEKPTCVNCTVHCYKPERREQIRQVMRHSGPRMPLRHPLLTVFHYIDGRRPAPKLKRGG